MGVGKTIEACLIIKELQARHRARSVLVICPKGLVVDDKWRGELKRFDEEFVHLDGAALRYCVEETLREDEWPARFSKAILPYSLLDRDLLEGVDRDGIRRPGLVDLAPGPRFDLVIIDEAHHIRNRPTYAYRNVARLTEAAEAVVMLSATPLQIDSQDLFTLVNLLRDDLVPTEHDFAQMLEPNHYLYEAVEAARGRDEHWQEGVQQALSGALATRWGRQVMAVDPRVGDIRDLLGAPGDDNRARVRVVRALEDLNTFSSIVTRTRRRDIGEFTTRKPAAPMVAFTPRQQVVHDAVLALGRQISQLQAPGLPAEFLLSMLYRQAASSISGLAPLVEQILNNRLDTVEFGEVGDDAPLVPPRILSEVASRSKASANSPPTWMASGIPSSTCCGNSWSTSRPRRTTRSCCSARFGTRWLTCCTQRGVGACGRRSCTARFPTRNAMRCADGSSCPGTILTRSTCCSARRSAPRAWTSSGATPS